MKRTKEKGGRPEYRSSVLGAAVALAIALAACGDTSDRAAADRPAKELSRAGTTDALRLHRSTVGWKRLGKGFVSSGMPLTVTVGPRGGTLKGKVVVRARSARKLGLWPNPQKLKDRSVGKREIEVRGRERRTLLVQPHARYRKHFLRARRRVLDDAHYQVRAVLRAGDGERLARRKQSVQIR